MVLTALWEKSVIPGMSTATQSPPRGRDGLSQQAQDALEMIRASPIPVSRREVGASKQVMGTLVRRGLVVAYGEPRVRRYGAAEQDNALSGGWEEHALKVPAASGRRHGTTDMRIARARILDHLSRRRLDEMSLCDHLSLDREVVADICGALLLEDTIAMLPDGRYEVVE